MILALKTASAVTEAWLYESAEAAMPQAELEWESGRDLADQLLGKIAQFLAESQARMADLTGIVIFSGPGSFTSLRIGHTTAGALADSLSIPIAGATGEDWAQKALAKLKTTPKGQPALPHYGSEANVTRPKT